MAFIAKNAPIAATVGNTVRIEERPMYGGKDIKAGDSLFLWTSEQQGGRGLWGRGIVLSSSAAGSKQHIEVRINQLVSLGHFGLVQIAPHRDSTDETPTAGLARKLYKHAHNKIARVTNAEADLLLRVFD